MDNSIAITVLLFFLMFQIKHLFADFIFQTPYMWMNKHKLLHPGGWLHAGTHAVASFVIFVMIHPPIVSTAPWWGAALILCGIELMVHFLIDLCKMRIGIRKGWKCNTHPQFWNLLGIDQFLHQLTYIWMISSWVLQ